MGLTTSSNETVQDENDIKQLIQNNISTKEEILNEAINKSNFLIVRILVEQFGINVTDYTRNEGNLNRDGDSNYTRNEGNLNQASDPNYTRNEGNLNQASDPNYTRNEGNLNRDGYSDYTRNERNLNSCSDSNYIQLAKEIYYQQLALNREYFERNQERRMSDKDFMAKSVYEYLQNIK